MDESQSSTSSTKETSDDPPPGRSVSCHYLIQPVKETDGVRYAV